MRISLAVSVTAHVNVCSSMYVHAHPCQIVFICRLAGPGGDTTCNDAAPGGDTTCHDAGPGGDTNLIIYNNDHLFDGIDNVNISNFNYAFRTFDESLYTRIIYWICIQINTNG